MSKAPSSAKRDRLKPIVPQLVDATDVYGDIWKRIHAGSPAGVSAMHAAVRLIERKRAG